MKKRILWINTSPDFTGGCESYIFHTAAHLRKAGFYNILLYNVEGWTEPSYTNGFDEAYPNVILERQIKEIAPQIIFVHRFKGISNTKILLNANIPVIRFFHDHRLFCLREHKYKTISLQTCTQPTGFRCLPCLGFLNRSSNWSKIKISSLGKLRQEQILNQKLTGFMVASDYMKKHLISHGFSNKKIIVNPLYSWKKQEKVTNSSTGKYFLYAGQVLRGKGVDIAIKSLALLPAEVKLYIAGKGKQLDEFKMLAEKSGLSSRIKFLGFVEQKKLVSLYKECIAVLMPSRVPETFGLAGLEAMSMQKPVIARNVGGISQWLQNNHNGILLKTPAAAELAEAMGRLYNNPQLAIEMGKNGYDKYWNEFQPERHIKVLVDFFQKL